MSLRWLILWNILVWCYSISHINLNYITAYLSYQSSRKSKRLANIIKVLNTKTFLLREILSYSIRRIPVNYNPVGVVRLLSIGLIMSGYFYTLFDNSMVDLSRAYSIGITSSVSRLEQGIYRRLQTHSFFSIRIFDKGVPGKQDRDVFTEHLIHGYIALLVCLFVCIC